MKWFLISGNGDDYGACEQWLYQGTKSKVKNVYNYKEIPDSDIEILKKYFDILNEYYDSNEEINEVLERLE